MAEYSSQSEDLARQLADLEASSGGEDRLSDLSAKVDRMSALLEDTAATLFEAEACEEQARSD